MCFTHALDVHHIPLPVCRWLLQCLRVAEPPHSHLTPPSCSVAASHFYVSNDEYEYHNMATKSVCLHVFAEK